MQNLFSLKLFTIQSKDWTEYSRNSVLPGSNWSFHRRCKHCQDDSKTSL